MVAKRSRGIHRNEGTGQKREADKHDVLVKNILFNSMNNPTSQVNGYREHHILHNSEKTDAT